MDISLEISVFPGKTVCLTYFHLHLQTCYFCYLVYFVKGLNPGVISKVG